MRVDLAAWIPDCAASCVTSSLQNTLVQRYDQRPRLGLFHGKTCRFCKQMQSEQVGKSLPAHKIWKLSDYSRLLMQNWLGIGIVVLVFTYHYITADPKYER